MTAADPNESSYACYFDEERNTYLGDCFSVNWMQESEREDLKSHSLHHIFEIVRTKTENNSHVEEYGDLDIGVTSISEILGFSNLSGSIGAYDTYRQDTGKDAIDSYQVPLQILYNKLRTLEKTNSKDEALLIRGQIKSVLEKRHHVENIMDELVFRMARKNVRIATELRNKKISINKHNIDCYDTVVKEFSKSCFKIAKNPFVASQLHVLVNACSIYLNKESKIIRDIQHICSKLPPMTDIV